VTLRQFQKIGGSNDEIPELDRISKRPSKVRPYNPTSTITIQNALEDNQTTLPTKKHSIFNPSSQELLLPSLKLLPLEQPEDEKISIGERMINFEVEIANQDFAFKSMDYAQHFIDKMLEGEDRNDQSRIMIAFKTVLGKNVRDMGEGDTFGERALEGHNIRTASVAAFDHSDFITLGVDEYNLFVKMRFKMIRDVKHQLLVDKFPAYSRLAPENLWNFQYLFQIKKGSSGQVLLDETSSKNRCILIKSGQVALYKHSGQLNNFLQWYSRLDYGCKNDEGLVEMAGQAVTTFGSIPSSEPVLVGYVGSSEIIGSEVLFGSSRISLFTAKVISSDIEYYEFDKQIEMSLSIFKMLDDLFRNFLKIFKYRLEYISKKLNVFSAGGISTSTKHQLAPYTNNFKLSEAFKQEANRVALNDSSGAEKKESVNGSLIDIKKKNQQVSLVVSENDLKIVEYLRQKDEQRTKAERRKKASLSQDDKNQFNAELGDEFNTEALNGRVSVWTNADLVKLYKKEEKKVQQALFVSNYLKKKSMSELPDIQTNQEDAIREKPSPLTSKSKKNIKLHANENEQGEKPASIPKHIKRLYPKKHMPMNGSIFETSLKCKSNKIASQPSRYPEPSDSQITTKTKTVSSLTMPNKQAPFVPAIRVPGTPSAYLNLAQTVTNFNHSFVNNQPDNSIVRIQDHAKPASPDSLKDLPQATQPSLPNPTTTGTALHLRKSSLPNFLKDSYKSHHSAAVLQSDNDFLRDHNSFLAKLKKSNRLTDNQALPTRPNKRTSYGNFSLQNAKEIPPFTLTQPSCPLKDQIGEYNSSQEIKEIKKFGKKYSAYKTLLYTPVPLPF